MLVIQQFLFHVLYHILIIHLSIGIRNREWVVRPFGSNKEAMPDDATIRTIFLFALRYETIVFHKNVLLVPP